MLRTLLLSAAALLLAAAASAQIHAPQDLPPRLLPGTGGPPRVLDLSGEGHSLASFVIDVPPSTRVLRVTLACELADLDLYVSPFDLPDELAPVDELLAGGPGTEMCVLDRFGDPPLFPGLWLVEVEWHADAPPRHDGLALARVPYTLSAELLPARVDGVLALDSATPATLDDGSGRFRTFRVDVPEDALALRVDLADTTADLDLRLAFGAPPQGPGDALLAGLAAYGRESLALSRDGTPPLRSGPWFVDVVEAIASGLPPTSFTLHVSARAEPPAALLALPDLRRPPGDRVLAPALAAVVEVLSPAGRGDFAGSGVLVSPDGWLLTNAHVVRAFGEAPLDELVVAASRDDRLPPVELFRARVVQHDAARDLALLRITAGLHGQPLPEGYRFPFLPLAAAPLPAIGDPLWLVGYPTTGGGGTRCSITATRGVVAGFERASFGVWIKTDAEIASGNSGGAALDAAGRLVALASSIVEDHSSQLGFLVPIDAVPAAWRTAIAGSD